MEMATMDLFNTIADDEIELTSVSCVKADRVLKKTLRKIEDEMPLTGTRRWGRLLLVVAAATLLLGTTVLASEFLGRYEDPMDMLGMAFGNREFQSMEGNRTEATYYGQNYDVVQPTVCQPPLDEEVAQGLVSGVQKIDRSVTYTDGTTLTVISHMHDPATHSGVFYCTVENPRGVTGYYTQSTGELSFREDHRTENLYVSAAACRLYLISGETTNTRLSLACYYIVPFTQEHKNLRIAQYKDKNTGISLDLTKFAPAQQWQSRNGAITVTPTGIVLRISQIAQLGYGRDLADMDKLVIRFADGSEYLVEENTDEALTINSKYWLITQDEDRWKTVAYGIFNRLVEVSQIRQVEINGEPIA